MKYVMMMSNGTCDSSMHTTHRSSSHVNISTHAHRPSRTNTQVVLFRGLGVITDMHMSGGLPQYLFEVQIRAPVH